MLARPSSRILLGFLALAPLPSQSLPSRPASRPELVDDAELLAAITRGCGELAQRKALVALDDLRKAAGAGPATAVPRPLRTERLEGPDLRDLALASTLVVGTYHLCDSCAEWHFVGASGFVVAEGGVVATCWHVLEPDPKQKEAKLAVADLRGRVWPVRAVLAFDAATDVCLLATDAKEVPALALDPDVRSGTRVACLSHPDDHFGFYSEGTVARWCVVRDSPVDAPESARKPGTPMLEVTLDFAKGSSGAPILDFRGNVIGLAQATQTVLYDDDTDPTGVQMVFKLASPARALAALIRRPRRAARPCARPRHAAPPGSARRAAARRGPPRS